MGDWPFKCPECKEDLRPIAHSVAWSGGGADLFECTKCYKKWWYVMITIVDPPEGFYLEGNKDPYEYYKRWIRNQEVLKRPKVESLIPFLI